MNIRIFTFYKFHNLTQAQVKTLESPIYRLAEKYEARGLMIFGTEGVNATLSAPEDRAFAFASDLTELLGMGLLDFKWSAADRHPFHDFKIRLREEIVTLSRTDIVPQGPKQHLDEKAWDKAIAEGAMVIDTRNHYEYEIGHFKNAIDPKIEEFSEFPKWLATSGIPKEQKVLIYCTGGIRCEKAIYAMEEQGYQNVYQLDGGILRYFEKKKAAATPTQYEGECFVFDYRVAVDQQLNPTHTFRLCPHCGQPGKTPIECIQCHVHAVVCGKCLEESPERKTCSKNCAHHFRMGHKSRRIHWDAFEKYAPEHKPKVWWTPTTLGNTFFLKVTHVF